MKICLKAADGRKEDVHVAHDAGLGFAIWIGRGEVHIRAKDAHEPDAGRTTLVIDTPAEIVQ